MESAIGRINNLLLKEACERPSISLLILTITIIRSSDLIRNKFDKVTFFHFSAQKIIKSATLSCMSPRNYIMMKVQYENVNNKKKSCTQNIETKQKKKTNFKFN